MPEKKTIIQYLSGGFFANGVKIILEYALSSYLETLSFLYQILGIWSITIFSGAVSGYFLTKNMKENHLLTGAIIGLYAYILYVLLSFLGIANPFDEIWIFLGFLLGGLLGGRLGEKGDIQLGPGIIGQR